jgi:NAD(P)-dependent dehydrogenase (short-subunit alcohol dehydrogenase family)
MELDLNGRTALVTGSTAGIGLGIARALLDCGAEVIVNGRTQARVDEALASLDNANARGLAADVATAQGCAALTDAEPDVDVLVNNAGTIDIKPVFETGDEDWESLFALNVMSGVRLSRHHIPRMAERGWGRVIFVSSESALHIPTESVHYGMTKAAQLAIARGMAESVPASGVTVNSVLPGPTLSELMTGMLQQRVDDGSAADLEEAGRAFIAEARPTSILERPAQVEEVANMVAYVASPLASATTGAALRVDGGVVRAIP